jgi:Zn finger protein HypA/HybF involved in hydrogenase expression
MARTDSLHCDVCDATVDPDDARRTGTYGNLDLDTWQTLCCPTCGSRLKTVLVGDE